MYYTYICVIYAIYINNILGTFTIAIDRNRTIISNTYSNFEK